MPQIIAWECPKTGKIFKSKRSYISYAKERAIHNIRIIKNMKIKKSIINNLPIKDCKSVQEICDFIMGKQTEIQIASYLLGHVSFYSDIKYALQEGKEVIFPKLTFIGIKTSYSDEVSNSHSSPRGKPTNWGGRDKEVPRGYPGLEGRIATQSESDETIIIASGKNKRDKTFYSNGAIDSDFLNGFGIYTGSGGGGENAGYDVKLFLEDFPELTDSLDLVYLRLQSDNRKAFIKLVNNSGKISGCSGNIVGKTYANAF